MDDAKNKSIDRYTAMKQCCNCFMEYSSGRDECPYCGFVTGSPGKDPNYLPPGTLLHGGEYIVGEAIKTGGFGIVYLAWDKKQACIIAIKEYFPMANVSRIVGTNDVMVNSSQIEKQREHRNGVLDFMEEGKILMKLSDVQGVCRIYAAFEENNTAYIAMEYVLGVNLKEYLRKYGYKNVPKTTIYSFMDQILECLDGIHERDIIHRDIAPDNILVKEDNTIKIIDLGAACQGGRRRLKDDVIIIKPGFAPPEQYEQGKDIGPWNDIYAAGATFYYLLTGKVPPESVERLENDTIVEPIEIDSTISKNINAAIMNALAPQIYLRTQTVKEFRKNISGRRGVTPEQKQKKKEKRKRIIKLAMALLVVAALVFGGVMWYTNKDVLHGKLTVWIGVSDNEALKKAELDRYQQVFDAFREKNPKVSIQVVAVPEKQIAMKFLSSSPSERPDLLETTYVSPEVRAQLADITYLRDSVSDAEQAFNAAKKTGYRSFPLSRCVQVFYVSKDAVPGGCRLVDTVSDFVNGTGDRSYFGDTSSFMDINKLLTEGYSIYTSQDSYVWYSDFFGVYKHGFFRETSAKKLLEYMASDDAQKVLHITNNSNMFPVTDDVLDMYLKLYQKLSPLRDGVNNYKITNQSNPDDLYRDRMDYKPDEE